MKETNKKRTFPCWVCKGQGDFNDGTFVDVGIGSVQVSAHSECGYCGGEGLIEIGGKIHKRITAERIAMDIIKFNKPKQEEWTDDELQEIGNKALNLL